MGRSFQVTTLSLPVGLFLLMWSIALAAGQAREEDDGGYSVSSSCPMTAYLLCAKPLSEFIKLSAADSLWQGLSEKRSSSASTPVPTLASSGQVVREVVNFCPYPRTSLKGMIRISFNCHSDTVGACVRLTEPNQLALQLRAGQECDQSGYYAQHSLLASCTIQLNSAAASYEPCRQKFATIFQLFADGWAPHIGETLSKENDTIWENLFICRNLRGTSDCMDGEYRSCLETRRGTPARGRKSGETVSSWNNAHNFTAFCAPPKPKQAGRSGAAKSGRPFHGIHFLVLGNTFLLALLKCQRLHKLWASCNRG